MISRGPSSLLLLATAGGWLLLLLLSSSSSSVEAARRPVDARAVRALEENGYQYIEDLSGYTMTFGKCVRVKVPNDDDDQEGNGYFLNGHYYAQGQQFASVYLCDKYSQSSSDNTCGICDTSKEYVTDLGTYIDTTLGYAAAMCQSCEAQCYRRQLEEDEEDEAEEEEQMMNVDCSTCVDTCKHMNFANYNENNGDDANYGQYSQDETMYLECQEAFQDGNGYDIYVGPQCTADGDITIGFYYDDECTVKSSSQEMDYGFEYGTFHGIQSMCVDCNPYGNGDGGVCQELYEDSTHCSMGRNLNNNGEDEDMPICKTYQKASKAHVYGSHQKEWKVVETIVAILLIGGFSWMFLTLSYTYYLRHRAKAAAAAGDGKGASLADNDHHTEPEVLVTDKAGLPPVA